MRNTIIYSLNILLAIIFLSKENTTAQSPNWVWAKQIGEPGVTGTSTIAIDPSGNIYMAGNFSGTVDFDPDTGTFDLTSTGSFDIYFSKFDASGHLIWVKSIGGTIFEYCASIALDDSGNVYTTGQFVDTVDFDPGIGTFNLTTSGTEDIFISKLDSSGNFVWAKAIGDTGTDEGRTIAIDGSGNVYTTGTFTGTVDFNPGIGVFNLISAIGFNIFISKLDRNGNFVWAKQLTGINGNGEGIDIALDVSGNVYTTGFFGGTVDFNPGGGIFDLTVNGGGDIFISKLDSSGNFKWAGAMGGVDYEEGHAIAIDDSGNVYTTGFFSGVADFDPKGGVFNLTSAGLSDMFISKISSAGNFVWAKSMGDISGDVSGNDIAFDVSGNVYTTGSFYNTIDFDPGIGIFNLTSAGDRDIFISKLNSSGNFIWAKAAGGIYRDVCFSLVIDNSSDVYIAGSYNSTSIIFGSDTLTFVTGTGFNSHIFIAKLDTAFVSGTNEIENFKMDILIFPNPASNYFTITFPGNYKNIQVAIADVTGKIIYSVVSSGTQQEVVNTNNFSEGIYLVQIKADNFVETRKIVIVK